MTPDQVPMMIQMGYRGIAVAFDVWGFANLVHGNLEQAKSYAKQAGEANGVPNGESKRKAPSS
jgi:4-hydroxy-2-oxoheptanedioate aldolase